MAYPSTVTISHNEVIVACRKAFEALGLPFGLAEDAAEAIGWLALHGLPYKDQLAAALNVWQLKPAFANPLSQQQHQSTWDAQGRSALYLFPNLIDYGSVQAQKTGAYTLTILNMPDISLMWGYAVCVQQRNIPFLLQWVDGDFGRRQVICAAGDDLPSINGFDATGDWPPEKVEIRFMQNDLMEAERLALRIASEDSLQAAAQGHTADGIQIDGPLWDKLTSLGKGLLVESTAESENRGAGGV